MSLTFGLADTLTGPWARTGRWLVGVWGFGALLGGVFSADPPGNWREPPSLPGMIHGNAAMVAFLALPFGAFFLARTFKHDDRWRKQASLLAGLAVAAAVSLAAFAASLVPVFVRPGPPILLGLSERVLLAVYAAWLATAAIEVIQCGDEGRHRRAIDNV